jgi:hypothetical protein
LDEEAVTQQAPAKTAGERQHKHPYGIVVTPDAHHRSGDAKKNGCSQINRNRERKTSDN